MQSYFTKASFALLVAGSLMSCATQSNLTSDKPAVAKTTAQASATSSRQIGTDKHGMPTYADAARVRYVRATAYSHMEKEPGAPGRKNAAGTILKYGKIRSAAADWSVLPLGTKFKIKGQPNHTYIVDDYGSALVGTNTVDIFKPTLRSMYAWGTRKIEITIVQMGSFERSAKLLKGRTKYWHCRQMYNAIQGKLKSKSSFAQNEIKK